MATIINVVGFHLQLVLLDGIFDGLKISSRSDTWWKHMSWSIWLESMQELQWRD
jgi:hypothetical protein